MFGWCFSLSFIYIFFSFGSCLFYIFFLCWCLLFFFFCFFFMLLFCGCCCHWCCCFVTRNPFVSVVYWNCQLPQRVCVRRVRLSFSFARQSVRGAFVTPSASLDGHSSPVGGVLRCATFQITGSRCRRASNSDSDSEFLRLRARRSGATRRDIPPLGHWDRPKSSPRTAQRSQQEPRPERLQKGHARITAGIGWRGLGIGDCGTRNWESGRVASGIRQADWQSKDKELQGRRMKEARTNSRGNHVALHGAFESAAALRAKFTVARPQMFEGNLLPLNIKYFAINILQTTICGMKLKCITY